MELLWRRSDAMLLFLMGCIFASSLVVVSLPSSAGGTVVALSNSEKNSFPSSRQLPPKNVKVSTENSHVGINAIQYTNFPQAQMDALYSLYQSTNGELWSWKNRSHAWDFSNKLANPCIDGWEGIHCGCSYNLTIEGVQNVNTNSRHARTTGETSISPTNMKEDEYSISVDIPSYPSSNGTIHFINGGDYGPLPYFLGNSSCPYQSDLTTSALSTTSITDIGVTSGFYNMTITAITLPNHRLNGPLPKASAFFDLIPNLLALDLSHNPNLLGPLTESTFPNSSISYSTHQSYQLQALLMNEVSFDSSLPTTMGNFPNLFILIIQSAQLKGPLPATALAKWTQLQALYLFDNHISGRIPIEACNMTKLSVIQLTYNRLTNTLPSCIYTSWPSLLVFDIEANHINGSFDQSIEQWQNAVFILTSSNLLTGSVPSTLQNLPNLAYFGVSYNYLTGKLVDWMPFDTAPIFFLGFGNNFFSGAMVDRCWIQLRYFYGFSNQLNGEFPNNLVNSCGEQLREFDLSENQLSDKIPANIFSNNSKSLVNFVISDNMLTGSFNDYSSKSTDSSVRSQAAFSSAPHLLGLLLFQNFFTGKFPSSIDNCHKLITFIIFNNLYSNELPMASFKQLSHLAIFGINGNLLSGRISDAFNFNDNNETRIQRFTYINIGGNYFTGTLPYPTNNISASRLISYTASSNCFHGNLPNTLCLSKNIQALSLEGLNTATPCRKIIVPSIFGDFEAFTTSVSISGTIPSCLFTLPHLSILALSGNALQGTIANIFNATLTPNLNTISLSHNSLTGTIPKSVLSLPQLSSLDLSINALNGTLKPLSFTLEDNPNEQIMIAKNLSLSLKLNRLSGKIPIIFNNLLNINILKGNYFACPYENQDLPKHDPEAHHFRCGSNQTNLSLYAWLLLMLFTCIALIVSSIRVFYALYSHPKNTSSVNTTTNRDSIINDLYINLKTQIINIRNNHEILSSFSLQQWILRYSTPINDVNIPTTTASMTSTMISREVSEVDDSIQRFSFFLHRCRQFAHFLILFIVCCLTPFYVYLSARYPTHTYSYIWVVSAIWIASIPASILMCITFLFLLGWMTWFIYWYLFPIIDASWFDKKDLDTITMNDSISSLDEIRIADRRRDNNASGKLNQQTNNLQILQKLLHYSKVMFIWSGFYIINSIFMIAINTLYVINYVDSTGVILFLIQILISSTQSLWAEVVLLHWYLWYKYQIVIPFLYKFDTQYMNNVNNIITSSNERLNSNKLTSIEQRLDQYDQIALSLFEVIIKLIIPCVVTLCISSACLNPIFASTEPVAFDITFCYSISILDIPCFNALASNSDGTSYTPPVIYYFECSSAFLRYYSPVYILTFVTTTGITLSKMLMTKYYDQCVLQAVDELPTVPLPTTTTTTTTAAAAAAVSDEGIQDDVKKEDSDVVETESPLHTVELNTPTTTMQSQIGRIPTLIQLPPFQPILHQDIGKEHLITLSLVDNIAEKNVIFRIIRIILPLSWYAHLPEHFSTDPKYSPISLYGKKQFLLSPHRFMMKVNVYFALLFVFGVAFSPLAFVIYIAILGLTSHEELMIKRILIRNYQICHGKVNCLIPLCHHAIPIALTSWKSLLIMNLILMILMESFIIFDTIGTTEGRVQGMIGSSILLVISLVMMIIMYIIVQVIFTGKLPCMTTMSKRKIEKRVSMSELRDDDSEAGIGMSIISMASSEQHIVA